MMFAKRWGIPAVVLVILALLPLLLELMGFEGRELRAQQGFLTLVLIWGIFALSYNIVYGLTGMMSLSHSLFFGLGALSVGIITVRLGFSIWIAMAISFSVSLLAAGCLGGLLVRVRDGVFVVASATLALIGPLLVIYFSDWTGGISGLRLPRQSLDLGIGQLTFLQNDVAYWFVAFIFVLCMGGFFCLLRTPLGLAFKLIRENEPKAQLLGYRTTQLKWVSFTLSGAIAGLAGALMALSGGSMDSGYFSWTHSIDALAWVVIGGVGTLWGPLIGVAVLLGIEQYAGDLFPLNSIALSGALLVFFALIAPKGICGFFTVLGGPARGHSQD